MAPLLTTKIKDLNLRVTLSQFTKYEVTELTIPFISPILIRSRTSPRTSQRAEKLATAHLSIFDGSTNLWSIQVTRIWGDIVIRKKIIKLHRNTNRTKLNTLLLTFHLPFLGLRSSPLPNFNYWRRLNNYFQTITKYYWHVSLAMRKSIINCSQLSKMSLLHSAFRINNCFFIPTLWIYNCFFIPTLWTSWKNKAIISGEKLFT